MTLKELSQLYYIRRMILRDNLKIEALKRQSGIGGWHTDGIISKERKNRIAEIEADLDELNERVEKRRSEYIKEQIKLERWIAGIEDAQTQLAFLLRFSDLLSWDQVAARLGGGNTAETAKKIVYRYLKKDEKLSRMSRKMY